MNQGLIPRRYAKALFLLAREKGQDKDLYGVMNSLNRAFADNPQLQATLANPHISADDKQSLVDAAAKPAKSALLTDLVKLLERNRRMEFLRDIALAYIEIYRQQNHIFRVDIASAMPLQHEELQRIQSLVKNHLPAGSTPEFSESVNPDLIGGFTISIDNQLLDASVASEFKQLRLKLLSH